MLQVVYHYCLDREPEPASVDHSIEEALYYLLILYETVIVVRSVCWIFVEYLFVATTFEVGIRQIHFLPWQIFAVVVSWICLFR